MSDYTVWWIDDRDNRGRKNLLTFTEEQADPSMLNSQPQKMLQRLFSQTTSQMQISS